MYSKIKDIKEIEDLPDALNYCWVVNGFLSSYVNECINISPYQPKEENKVFKQI